jgi:hypothetical protein
MAARCVLYYNTILARETLRSPVASLWLWCFWGTEPHSAPVKRFAVSSLARGAFLLLLHPHDQGAFHSPRGPLDRLFRHPAHEQREISALPYAIPSTNLAQVGCVPTIPFVGLRPAFRLLDFDQGQSLDTVFSFCRR